MGLASTAEAQQPELGVSYAYARITNGDGMSLPAGFLVSVAGGSRRSPWLVGEVGGDFGSERRPRIKLITAHGGLRIFSTHSAGVRPFAQFLVGVTKVKVGNASDTRFSFEPAAGLDVPIEDAIAFRAGVGLPIVVGDGEDLKVFRFTLGLVFGGR